MKVALEIFFIKLVGEEVSYQKTITDISSTSLDPTIAINEAISKTFLGGNVPIQDHYIVHSTSWRFDEGTVILTYIVYSEKFQFPHKDTNVLPLSNLRIEPVRFQHGNTVIGEVNVISHAIRHLGFLVGHDSEGKYVQATSPETIEKLKKIYPVLAGRI
ncbi:hypothetical protein IT418_03575 [bacterium]|nr:hypothetical protein [bacterium]